MSRARNLFGHQRRPRRHPQRQHVSNGRLKYRRDKTSVPIDVPVLPELQASIDATPVGNLTFIVTEFGRPFTPLGFGNRVRA
jgi:hypothetical protein